MPQPLSPFEAPLHKLNWGRHRTSELAWLIQEHDKANPFKKKRTADSFIFEREKSYPYELALVLGDAIHNLRTSLDLLASDLARLNGKSASKVYFPFAESAKALSKEIKRKNFSRAGPAAVELLHKIGPHHNGNEALRGLHDLDVMDKHKLILPVLHGFRAENFRLKGPSGELVAEFIQGEGDGFSVNAQPGDEATLGSITFITVLARDAPAVFAEKPVLETLETLAKLARDIIEAFSALSQPNKVHKPTSPVSNDDPVKSV